MSENRRQWYIDKSINVITIVTAFGIIASTFSWASSIEKKGELNAQEISYLKEKQTQDSARIEIFRAEMREDVGKIQGKLDHILEYSSRK